MPLLEQSLVEHGSEDVKMTVTQHHRLVRPIFKGGEDTNMCIEREEATDGNAEVGTTTS